MIDLSQISPKKQDFTKSDLYRPDMQNPFERSLKTKMKSQLPQLKKMFNSLSQRQSEAGGIGGVPRQETNYFQNKKEANESITFKLPELSNQSMFTSNMRSPHKRSPYARKNEPTKFSKNTLYNGTMGKVKKNFKKHMATLEHHINGVKGKGALPDISKAASSPPLSPDAKSPDVSRDEPSQISISIEKLQENFKRNPSVKKKKAAMESKVRKKKKHFSKIKRRKAAESKQMYGFDPRLSLEEMQDDHYYKVILKNE